MKEKIKTFLTSIIPGRVPAGVFPAEKNLAYRKKLEQEKKRLIKAIKTAEKPENFGNDTDAFDEEADEAEAFASGMAISQTLRDRVNEIDLALARIRSGAYGVCTNCKQTISEKLLEIVPESSWCEQCKKSQRKR
ncbi:MAG: hypothetical protein A3A43_02050 [Candidatus Liptonbacteria bacterium RIFCSPLOWO2_01_FULL_56_20]|uniref:Uncharacterized protein n=1 Tax=Candidatus Liptonbacteria bacterium RIFCSPLOWO2_01_FULL_56_20 TaxID=1798652 RepID=A0A1G2CGZ6_9BACT|nr:MAG: Transcriptional regulator, TraR/DksA family [Parcubacteria group bacterium GW2011_GWB1_56_8]OGY97520.1 MAG: hypothetical protein A2681_00860 [Candidatus Liptonbacteria bacterium RIFCSPHIGHO2_01_FULL_56_18b]OGZ00669.1 MAG: hypothetical protein A3A43_02050 [Candidatus Liptonbacteria bacterium RIFCSPLOWO2_01_FULL_56_20]